MPAQPVAPMISHTAQALDAPPAALSVQVVRERADIASIRPEWTELRASRPATGPNADHDRYLATLDALGDSAAPYVAVLRRAGRCTSLLVGRTSTSRTRHRLGYWSFAGPRLRLLEIVYDGVLTDGSSQATRDILDHLTALRAARSFDAISFNHLPAGLPLDVELQRLGALPTASDRHWVVDVSPGSLEETLAHHSGDFRKKLRRYERKASEHFGGNLTLRTYAEPSQVPEFIRIMDGIASRSYKSRIPVSNAGAAVWGPLLDAEARAGRLRCFVLEGANEPIAYQVGSIHGSTYHGEGRGYDARFRDLSPGTVLFTMVLRDLCNLNVTQVDFGFGDAEHKSHFGTRSWTETSLRWHGLGWRPAADAAIARSVAAAGRFARRLLGGAGVMNRVKQWARKGLVKRGPAPKERA